MNVDSFLQWKTTKFCYLPEQDFQRNLASVFLGIKVLPQEVLFYSMSCPLQMSNDKTQKNLIERKQC